MIVDPNTGEIIDITQPAATAQSMTGQVGIDAAQSVGYDQGALINMLSHVPTATTSMMWNAGRGSQTLIQGGYGPEINNRGFLRSHIRPKSFRRLGSVYNIDPTGAASRAGGAGPNSPPSDRLTRKGGMYSPFQFIARGANWAGNSIARRTLNAAVSARTNGPNIGSRMHQAMGRAGIIDSSINNTLREGGKAQFFSPGALSRGVTISRLMGTNLGNIENPRARQRVITARRNALTNARKLNPGGFLDDLTDFQFDGAMHRRNFGYAMAASARGRATQFSLSYMSSAMGGEAVDMFGNQVRSQASGRAIRAGMERATGHLAAGGLMVDDAGRLVIKEGGVLAGKYAAGEAAGMAGRVAAIRAGGSGTAVAMGARGMGGALKAVPYVGQFMMAMDLTRLASAGMVGVMQTAQDAITSFKGSIDKPIMGMGYKDNTVAATSRARGVMAIQNSRLNARSVLGSEAGMLAAHFG